MYHKRNKVLALFCSDLKQRYHLRGISRLAKTSLRTTARVMEWLEQENIVRHQTEGKHKYFELNLDNVETKFFLIEAEISKTLSFLRKYPVFKSFLKDLVTADGMVVVFGSFSKLTATKSSDVDVLIVSDNGIDLPKHLLPYKVNPISLNRREFLSSLDKGEPLMKEILANHTILYNHSSFVDTMWWHYGRKG